MFRSPLALLVAATVCGCSGGEEEAPPVDPVEEACFRVAEGTVIDAGPSPEEATELELGLDPWRVGLYPDQVSYVSLTTTGAPVVVMVDAIDVFASLTTDGVEQLLPETTENPTCSQDIPAVLELDLPAGTHILGVGPHYKATLWMVLAERG
jgi:hypothetical protein